MRSRASHALRRPRIDLLGRSIAPRIPLRTRSLNSFCAVDTTANNKNLIGRSHLSSDGHNRHASARTTRDG